MRSILLHVHEDRCFEARLQVALDLARAFDGHVTCVQTTPFDVVMPGDLYGTFAAEIMPVMRETAEKVRGRVEEHLANEDVAWDWVDEDGLASDILLRRSVLSDVVVLGACNPEADEKSPSRLAGTVAINARVPVLVVPENARGLDAGGPAVVAWNGSPESSRALRGALPILKRASTVTLVTVLERGSDTDLDLPPTEGAQYLSRHGIACDMVECPADGDSVAATLANVARARDASSLVIGAYGRPRLVETVLGGVTRDLLSEPPLPIFACH